MKTEELIGEELVDAANVNAFADRMFEEAERLWASSSSDWQLLSKSPVVNESIAVSGAFASAHIDVVRATASVDAPAQFVFDLLVSADGYKIIDPFSDPKDHEKPPLETFDTSSWRDHSGLKRLEVTNAVAKIPLMHTREFVVLNAIDAHARMFASKSIQHKSVPGASVWGPKDAQAAINPKTVRALNTFAVRVEPADGKDATAKCVVKLINYANLAGHFSTTIQNQFNKSFLTSVVGRLQKAVDKAKLQQK